MFKSSARAKLPRDFYLNGVAVQTVRDRPANRIAGIPDEHPDAQRVAAASDRRTNDAGQSQQRIRMGGEHIFDRL